MSRLDATEPLCTKHSDAIEVLVNGRSKDLGGFCVRRVLPAPLARRVGPFVFFDEMGPADFPPGQGINVRPHPHIGLATVTFLLEGEILHRDSLGYVQPIKPGAVNLMTAGSGIVHSERTDPALEHSGQRLHGLQVWMALPENRQEIDPGFKHYPQQDLPVVNEDGVQTTVIIGDYKGRSSPVQVYAKTLYLSQKLDEGATLQLNPGVEQVAVYVVSGEAELNGTEVGVGAMAVLAAGSVSIRARQASQVMVIGGEDIGHREMYWNFVHTSKDRIEMAKQQWREMKFAPVPDDDEFIPLPLR